MPIDEDILRRDGLTLRNTPAKTPDKEVNNLHVDIVGLTAQQLIRLARRINTAFSPRVMTRSEILGAAAKFFQQNKFDRNFLFSGGNKGRSEEEITISKNLLVNLWKKALYLDSELTSGSLIRSGSDYVHSESTFPRSRKIQGEILEGVPEDEQAKIAAGNTARVYNFDVAKLAAPA